jgi:hypothetical protein
MNKTNAKKMAETITFNQVKEMFDNAKAQITDWSEVSAVNKGMTKGAAWNILKHGVKPEIINQPLALKNMIWEFGDYYLPELLKINKPSKKQIKLDVHHQEPVFNYVKVDLTS